MAKATAEVVESAGKPTIESLMAVRADAPMTIEDAFAIMIKACRSAGMTADNHDIMQKAISMVGNELIRAKATTN